MHPMQRLSQFTFLALCWLSRNDKLVHLEESRVLAPTTSKWPLASDKYYCLAIVDLPYIVAPDWKYTCFLSGVLAILLRMVALNAVPCQELLHSFACVKEHRLACLPRLLCQNMHLCLCVVRRLDDRLLVRKSSRIRALSDCLLYDTCYIVVCKLTRAIMPRLVCERSFLSPECVP